MHGLLPYVKVRKKIVKCANPANRPLPMVILAVGAEQTIYGVEWLCGGGWPLGNIRTALAEMDCLIQLLIKVDPFTRNRGGEGLRFCVTGQNGLRVFNNVGLPVIM